MRGAYWAHPRSRGENRSRGSMICPRGGSSPLTRGKQTPLFFPTCNARLIPAHAGKTRSPVMARRARRAHPRSRGENAYANSLNKNGTGSSQLTRGKRPHDSMPAVLEGLIPAHAGKTPAAASPHSCQGAHPRSRGENRLTRACRPRPRGSSPLTRGKQDVAQSPSWPEGLIPAHAGKTSSRAYGTSAGWAHPRSRGEN